MASQPATALSQLLARMELEQIGEDLFRGWSYDIGTYNIFGGHVLGQAMIAACRTVEGEERFPHSLHAYFLRPAAHEDEILYQVERIRDGRTFGLRQVSASQRGRPIFTMSVSFHVEEPGPEHQSTMPDAPGPEELLSTEEYRRNKALRFPERLRDLLLQEQPIEFRPVVHRDPQRPELRPPLKQVWMRAAGPLPDQVAVHRALLAYASDFSLLATSFLPHGLTFFQEGVQAVSLDHALWFHRPFRADEWLLYDMESPCAHGGRAMARGSIFTRDGRLVASVAQEGLIRVRGL